MKIIITGPKASGKTTIGKGIAGRLNVPFYDIDLQLEDIYTRDHGESLSFREIYKKIGEVAFRKIECRAVDELAGKDWCVVATGGSTMMEPASRNALAQGSIVLLLKGEPEQLWARMLKDGLPAFLEGQDGFRTYEMRTNKLFETVSHLADIVIAVTDNTLDDIERIIEEIESYMMNRMFSPSTFGEVIRVMTFGESHGPAVGAVVDGLKPGIALSESDIQKEMDRRRPGQSRMTTSRAEKDRVRILSGVFDGKTTGTPVCIVVFNEDKDSSKYDEIRELFRPGHADFTFWKKYGIRDHRGGGRSSGRETAARVAAGAIAKKILSEKGIEIIAYAEEIAGIKGSTVDFGYIEKNPVRAADPEAGPLMEAAIRKAKAEGDSVGGIVRLIVKNVPHGLGDPVFYKLDARLGMAFFSIGAVKGVEIGSGFESSRARGSMNNDQIENGQFLTNNAGGILGGISTGQDITARIAVKPTPSIHKAQKTVDTEGHNRTIEIEGRHDPCIVPRIIPVVESMTALVILDALEIQSRIK